MPCCLAVLMTAMLAGGPAHDALTVEARLVEGRAVTDGSPALDVRIRLADGWSYDQAGLPKLRLQLDLPDGLTPKGEVVTGRQLMRTGFVREPWERLVEPGTTLIELTLAGTPAPDARIGVNVTGYLRADGAEDAWFVRRRVELPALHGATSSVVATPRSDWGPGDAVQIGEPAPDIRLPRADGSEVTLSSFRGRKNVVITTYRAHW